MADTGIVLSSSVFTLSAPSLEQLQAANQKQISVFRASAASFLQMLCSLCVLEKGLEKYLRRVPYHKSHFQDYKWLLIGRLKATTSFTPIVFPTLSCHLDRWYCTTSLFSGLEGVWFLLPWALRDRWRFATNVGGNLPLDSRCMTLYL